MKNRSSFGFMVICAVVLGASVAGAAWRWREKALLRVQLESLQAGAGELAGLRAESDRLRAQQVSPAELAALRADHAALARLRAEIEALRKRP